MKRTHPPSRASRRAEEVRSLFEANYRPYQYCFVEFLTTHLSDLSRAFRGDLQAMIILAIVGQVLLRATVTAVERGQNPRDIPAERLSITASRLADVTGIPRETVRRKLQKLERKGWIMHDASGSWRLVVTGDKAPARDDLAEFDTRAMERVAWLFCDLEQIVIASTLAHPTEANAGAQFGQAPHSAGG